MSIAEDRCRDESTISSYFEQRLAPLLRLVERTLALCGRTVDAVADHPGHGPAAKVGLLLLTRLENEARACSILALRGYGLQAMGITATVIELVGTLSYIGTKDARAVEWARHTDKKRAYPRRVADGVDAALDALAIGDQTVRASWHGAHTFVCMAKHANPILSLNYGIRGPSGGEEYVRGPDSSQHGVFLSAESLYNLVFFCSAGLFVASAHSSDSGIRDLIKKDAHATSELLFGIESWFREATRFTPQGSPPRDNGHGQGRRGES